MVAVRFAIVYEVPKLNGVPPFDAAYHSICLPACADEAPRVTVPGPQLAADTVTGAAGNALIVATATALAEETHPFNVDFVSA